MAAFMTRVSLQEAVYVAVIGPGGDEATEDDTDIARRVGQLLAARDAILVCGGLYGVMAAASQGASEEGGLTIGLLPGRDRTTGNPHLSVALPTALGELRNALVVGVSDAVIAVGGSWGTLNEITLAMKNKTPTIVIGGWKVDDLCHAAEESFHRATSAEQAVAKALELAARRKTWVEHGDNA